MNIFFFPFSSVTFCVRFLLPKKGKSNANIFERNNIKYYSWHNSRCHFGRDTRREGNIPVHKNIMEMMIFKFGWNVAVAIYRHARSMLISHTHEGIQEHSYPPSSLCVLRPDGMMSIRQNSTVHSLLFAVFIPNFTIIIRNRDWCEGNRILCISIRASVGIVFRWNGKCVLIMKKQIIYSFVLFGYPRNENDTSTLPRNVCFSFAFPSDRYLCSRIFLRLIYFDWRRIENRFRFRHSRCTSSELQSSASEGTIPTEITKWIFSGGLVDAICQAIATQSMRCELRADISANWRFLYLISTAFLWTHWNWQLDLAERRADANSEHCQHLWQTIGAATTFLSVCGFHFGWFKLCVAVGVACRSFLLLLSPLHSMNRLRRPINCRFSLYNMNISMPFSLHFSGCVSCSDGTLNLWSEVKLSSRFSLEIEA